MLVPTHPVIQIARLTNDKYLARHLQYFTGTNSVANKLADEIHQLDASRKSTWLNFHTCYPASLKSAQQNLQACRGVLQLSATASKDQFVSATQSQPA